jgi:hypothetical protein
MRAHEKWDRTDALRTEPGSKNSSALYDATCKHGDIECRGNIQQLCAADLWEIPSSSRGDRKSQTEPDASGDVNVSLKGNQAWEDWWNVRKACFSLAFETA